MAFTNLKRKLEEQAVPKGWFCERQKMTSRCDVFNFYSTQWNEKWWNPNSKLGKFASEMPFKLLVSKYSMG